MTRYRVVSPTAIQVRVAGVLTTAYAGDVIQIDSSAEAQRLVNEGAVVPEPAP